MTSAEAAAALEGVQTAAVQSLGAPAEAVELPAVLQAFEDVLTGCLKATGARSVLVGRPAPSGARAARRLRVRNHPRLAALLREHRNARRTGDISAIRALERRITTIRRALRAHEALTRQRALVALATENKSKI
jgi:hypothetical protein